MNPRKMKIEFEAEIPDDLLQLAVHEGYTEESLIELLQELIRRVVEYWLSNAAELLTALKSGLITYDFIAFLSLFKGLQVGSELAQKYMKKEERQTGEGEL